MTATLRFCVPNSFMPNSLWSKGFSVVHHLDHPRRNRR
ncbi:hypothetical protein HDA39_002166 [Kribbella italica]|uniref:Uncharacterized protein n=1 Tax=Kribbella italica TaxID=1540520 RepID=A0A7W9J4E7_9ACTN|nr:hypothetical protein [Kribbella italica]